MLSYWDIINFSLQDSSLMVPGFTLITEGNLQFVYGLFLKNESEIFKQIPKVQLVLIVLYVFEQMPLRYESNMVSFRCYVFGIYYVIFGFKRLCSSQSHGCPTILFKHWKQKILNIIDGLHI